MALRTRVWGASKLVLLGVALLATYVLFAAASMRLALRSREVQVPDVVNRTATDASGTLALAGLSLQLDPARRVDPKIAAGRVVSQEPAAGATLRSQRAVKVWLSAGAEERARRRSAQTREPYTAVLEAMRRRDELDGSREVAPMQRAPDAVDVETDGLTAADVANRIVQLARERGARPAGAGVEA